MRMKILNFYCLFTRKHFLYNMDLFNSSCTVKLAFVLLYTSLTTVPHLSTRTQFQIGFSINLWFSNLGLDRRNMITNKGSTLITHNGHKINLCWTVMPFHNKRQNKRKGGNAERRIRDVLLSVLVTTSTAVLNSLQHCLFHHLGIHAFNLFLILQFFMNSVPSDRYNKEYIYAPSCIYIENRWHKCLSHWIYALLSFCVIILIYL